MVPHGAWGEGACVVKPRLGVKRTEDRVWAVRVLVEDGGWTFAEVGSHAEALALALERLDEGRVRSVEVVEVPS